MIPTQIASAFPPVLRSRGGAYHREGRVRVRHASNADIQAIVRGTEHYVVSLEAMPGELLGTCSCPFAMEQGVCKHLWATLLQVDETGQLAPLVKLVGGRATFSTLDEDGNMQEIQELEEEDDMEDVEVRPPWSDPRAKRPAPRPLTSTAKQSWKTLLDLARHQMAPRGEVRAGRAPNWPADRRLIYIVDVPATFHSAGLAIELAVEKQARDGGWGAPVAFRLGADVWAVAPDPVDRQIAQMLLGSVQSAWHQDGARTSGFALRGAAIGTTLRLICETGRCRVRLVAGERPTDVLRWDDGPPWKIRLRIAPVAGGQQSLTAVLERAGEEMSLAEPDLLHAEGVVLAHGVVSRLEHEGAFGLLAMFRSHPSVPVPGTDLPALIESLYALPRLPALDLPAGTSVSEKREPPLPCVSILPDANQWRGSRRPLKLQFLYGTTHVSGEQDSATVFDRASLTVRHRDRPFENAARAQLVALGAKEEWTYGDMTRGLVIGDAKVGALVVELLRQGWQVDAKGVPYRSAGMPRAEVRSGIDWFELDAGVRFGDHEVALHDLLAARRAGETSITLSDGSIGLLPLEWLSRLGPVIAGGTRNGTALRYKRSQVALLDALLNALPGSSADATFEKARVELRTFDSIAPVDPESTFAGTLREYQREGLAWLHFLRRFGLGGCLADDMGLGKTVQVLALLDARRAQRAQPSERRPRKGSPGPSIVVVPKSLIFNWKREAERFAPRLRVLEHLGTGRDAAAIDATNTDVVLTTYGTLRRDAAALAGIQFDYAILDEAQAIKNPTSASAKAARLLVADHRLAMTGTPIENRIEELWSLMDFLNPGMLGSASGFGKLARLGAPKAGGGEAVDGGRDLFVRALRPVILRRTKEQVATDLPPRMEQTLTVELEGAQRKFYDTLLQSYRQSVLERVDRVGVGKARMHILEALLRLRQAACHPALADARQADAPSAKLDALMPALDEVVAQGHKALVFSQFTSFLALLRTRLDAAGTHYEYLDGRVRDRQARVDRFQSDAACPLFLISLKAGGQGLNLTAADYVYILDPWWNPAVEAQAIDRAHRIGQSRHVIATRLVARGTIEEKILELQASKRALADAILGQDQGVLAQIGRSELEMLLG